LVALLLLCTACTFKGSFLKDTFAAVPSIVHTQLEVSVQHLVKGTLAVVTSHGVYIYMCVYRYTQYTECVNIFTLHIHSHTHIYMALRAQFRRKIK